jgi:hypothetical protein
MQCITKARLATPGEKAMLAIRFTSKEEAKALPILLRHSAGIALPGRIYVVSENATKALAHEGIRFRLIARTETSVGAKDRRL